MNTTTTINNHEYHIHIDCEYLDSLDGRPVYSGQVYCDSKHVTDFYEHPIEGGIYLNGNTNSWFALWEIHNDVKKRNVEESFEAFVYCAIYIAEQAEWKYATEDSHYPTEAIQF